MPGFFISSRLCNYTVHAMIALIFSEDLFRRRFFHHFVRDERHLHIVIIAQIFLCALLNC